MVSFAAVTWVVTQRFSSLTAAEHRTTFLTRHLANQSLAFKIGSSPRQNSLPSPIKGRVLSVTSVSQPGEALWMRDAQTAAKKIEEDNRMTTRPGR